MDVGSFLSGSFLTHLDLPAPTQIWTIRDVKQQMVGTDTKICVYFNEHQKALGLNKTNLRMIVDGYTCYSETWLGRPIELRKDRCDYQGRDVDCVRVTVPHSGGADPQHNAVSTTQAPLPAQQHQPAPVPPATSAPPSAVAAQPVAGAPVQPPPVQQPVASAQPQVQGGQQASEQAPWQ